VENSLEGSVTTPLLKATMTGLIRWVAWREILPRRACSQNPQHSIQHIPRIAPRATPSISSHSWLGKKRFDKRPLRFGQVHAISLRGGWGGLSGGGKPLRIRQIIALRIYEIGSSILMQFPIINARAENSAV
jgi:hypothetical protein